MQEGDSVLRHRYAKARRFALRRGVAAMMALAIGSFGLLTGCTPTPVASMVSTGDSIARGFDACRFLSDCTAVSYATGTDPSSGSLYRRLLAANPKLAGHEYNDAQIGARASDLFSQMSLAVYQRADVVTVLIGANDACRSTVGDMTPVSDFKSSITQAFGLFFSNRPGARVLLSSIPDLYMLWEVAHTNAHARAIWQAAALCPSMLANPTSTAKADQLRRTFVTLQIARYNATLAAVCKEYPGCRWDGGAVGRYQFALAELSPFDYFHPNPNGQRAIAALAWKAYRTVR